MVLTERRIMDLNGALIRQTQGRNDSDGLYWKEGRHVFETFDCKNSLEARLAIVPSVDDTRGSPVISARLVIGEHAFDFPIGDKTRGFHHAAIEMTVLDSASDCPRIRLDDGVSTPILVFWSIENDAFDWLRS